MQIKPIRSGKDYTQALKRLEDLFDAKRNTLEGDEAEILNKKRKLGFEMIKKISVALNIPTHVLI